MERVLEPEVMVGPNATAYADTPLDEVNEQFCRRVLAAFPEILTAPQCQLLDVGCGPGDIATWLAEQSSGLQVTLLDASRDMLSYAERRVESHGVQDRARICHGRVPDVELAGGSFDFVISNTFLHHVPRPQDFWAWAKRLVKPGGGVFVRDLRQPESLEHVDALLDRYAVGYEPLHREDFRNSFLAALTLSEVENDLKATGMSALEVAPFLDRYWVAFGRA